MDIQKINKAIINEDIDFFANNSLKYIFKKAAFSSAIRTGRFNMIKQLIALNYWTDPEPSVLRAYFQQYDRPDIVEIFLKHQVDLSYCGDEYTKLSVENNNFKTVSYLVEHVDVSYSALLVVFDNIILKVRNISDLEEIYPIYKKVNDKLIDSGCRDSRDNLMHQLPQDIQNLFFHTSLDKNLNKQDKKEQKLKI